MVDRRLLMTTLSSTGPVGLSPFRTWYFRSTTPAEVSPSFDGAWTRTTEALRRMLAPSADASDTAAFTDVISFTAGQVVLVRQHVGPMMRGNALLTGATVTAILRAVELDAADNVSARLGVRVCSADGGTIRETLLAVGSYGSGAEFSVSPTGESRVAALDQAITSYVTQPGDRIVVETGAADAAGTTPQTALYYGSSRGADYTAGGVSSALNPWLRITPAAA